MRLAIFSTVLLFVVSPAHAASYVTSSFITVEFNGSAVYGDASQDFGAIAYADSVKSAFISTSQANAGTIVTSAFSPDAFVHADGDISSKSLFDFPGNTRARVTATFIGTAQVLGDAYANARVFGYKNSFNDLKQGTFIYRGVGNKGKNGLYRFSKRFTFDLLSGDTLYLSSSATSEVGINGKSGFSTIYLDPTISVSSVPEPATWAMMIFGFGAIGVTVRQRNRRSGHLAVRACTRSGLCSQTG